MPSVGGGEEVQNASQKAPEIYFLWPSESLKTTRRKGHQKVPFSRVKSVLWGFMHTWTALRGVFFPR